MRCVLHNNGLKVDLKSCATIVFLTLLVKAVKYSPLLPEHNLIFHGCLESYSCWCCVSTCFLTFNWFDYHNAIMQAICLASKLYGALTHGAACASCCSIVSAVDGLQSVCGYQCRLYTASLWLAKRPVVLMVLNALYPFSFVIHLAKRCDSECATHISVAHIASSMAGPFAGVTLWVIKCGLTTTTCMTMTVTVTENL